VEHSLNATHVTLKESADSLTRRQTKAQILAKAPANCRGTIAHFKLPSNEFHFTAWRQADDSHWYNWTAYHIAAKRKSMLQATCLYDCSLYI
jgi:hypothetical protein